VIGRIKTSFGFSSTLAEVVQDIDLTGKQSIVTGGSSGIGIETARGLARGGAAVTLAVRRPEVGASVVADIQKSTGNPNVLLARLDLSDQSSVREFAADWQGPLHILVNNAGIMALPKLERSPEGWEIQFATNFLGHFALTWALHNALGLIAQHQTRRPAESDPDRTVMYDRLLAYERPIAEHLCASGV